MADIEYGQGDSLGQAGTFIPSSHFNWVRHAFSDWAKGIADSDLYFQRYFRAGKKHEAVKFNLDPC